MHAYLLIFPLGVTINAGNQDHSRFRYVMRGAIFVPCFHLYCRLHVSASTPVCVLRQTRRNVTSTVKTRCQTISYEAEKNEVVEHGVIGP